MKKISATIAKNEFGNILMKVQKEPITISRNGKDVAVILSADEYKEIKEPKKKQKNSSASLRLI